MKRFYDQEKYEVEFTRHIQVVCPKCGMQATVLSDDYRWKAKVVKVSCLSCGYNENWKPGPRGLSIGVVKRRCIYCGRRLEKKFTAIPHPHQARLECSSCHTVMLEAVTWYSQKNGPASDPYFGYSLWYSGLVNGQVLWAYNLEHLEFIKQYVAATVRLREPNKNATLASRLPSWILEKNNREAVLKEIKKIGQL